MPYDEGLRVRLEEWVDQFPNLSFKKMFGGICWFLAGNICFGILDDFLILRTGPEKADILLKNSDIKVFDITGKAMKGWVMVSPDAYQEDKALLAFMKNAYDFVKTLPKK